MCTAFSLFFLSLFYSVHLHPFNDGDCKSRESCSSIHHLRACCCCRLRRSILQSVETRSVIQCKRYEHQLLEIWRGGGRGSSSTADTTHRSDAERCSAHSWKALPGKRILCATDTAAAAAVAEIMVDEHFREMAVCVECRGYRLQTRLSTFETH